MTQRSTHKPMRRPRRVGRPSAGHGRIPPLASPRSSLSLLLLPLAVLLPLQSARAEASLALCQRWQRSSGTNAILLGNAIGAAAYLTKVRRFAESDPQHPELLYSPADLQRACDAWH